MILCDLSQIKDVHVNKSYKCNLNIYSLHLFADVSIRYYGAVAYISDGRRSDFIITNSRLAPVKPLTVPQLELTALTLAARLAMFVVNAFINETPFRNINVWSDSEIALACIKNYNCSKFFVQNMVNEILKFH